MAFLLRLAESFAAIARGVGSASVWLLLVMVAVICLDVVTRKLNLPIPFLDSTRLQELEWHFHGVLFLLCLGYAYLKDVHVRIDVVSGRLGPRARAWLELIGCLAFSMPLCVVIVWIGSRYWYQSFLQNESSDAATGLPWRWLIKGFIPVGLAVLLTAVLSILLRQVVYLFGPADLREKARTVTP